MRPAGVPEPADRSGSLADASFPYRREKSIVTPDSCSERFFIGVLSALTLPTAKGRGFTARLVKLSVAQHRTIVFHGKKGLRC